MHHSVKLADVPEGLISRTLSREESVPVWHDLFAACSTGPLSLCGCSRLMDMVSMGPRISPAGTQPTRLSSCPVGWVPEPTRVVIPVGWVATVRLRRIGAPSHPTEAGQKRRRPEDKPSRDLVQGPVLV